jgi:hypothetical protein
MRGPSYLRVSSGPATQRADSERAFQPRGRGAESERFTSTTSSMAALVARMTPCPMPQVGPSGRAFTRMSTSSFFEWCDQPCSAAASASVAHLQLHQARIGDHGW